MNGKLANILALLRQAKEFATETVPAVGKKGTQALRKVADAMDEVFDFLGSYADGGSILPASALAGEVKELEKFRVECALELGAAHAAGGPLQKLIRDMVLRAIMEAVDRLLEKLPRA